MRAALLAIASLVLAVFMTWPLAVGLGSLGRTGVTNDPRFGTNGDGMFCLWNVSWVARTVIADPLNLFDASRNLRASMAAAGHPLPERDAA